MQSRLDVYLCSDDADVLISLPLLLHERGYRVRTFGGGTDLLEAVAVEPQPLRAIYVLDLHNPPMDGDVLHGHLVARGYARSCPVLFLSDRSTLARAVIAVSKGALGFVQKPFTDETLLSLLERAMEEGIWNQALSMSRDDLLPLWDNLTRLQRRVALLIEKGYPVREIAGHMHFTQRAAQTYRASVFEAMGVDTRAQLSATMAAMRAAGMDVDTV